MSEETSVVATTEARLVDPVQTEALANHVELATPTAEQIEAANRLFVQQREADLAAGMAGMWTGMVVLHGLVVDTLREDEERGEVPPAEEPGRPGRPG